jgi:hypothetical protein
MEIVAPCVVTLTWVLHDAQGEPIDALKEPLEFFSVATICWPSGGLAGKMKDSRPRCT